MYCNNILKTLLCLCTVMFSFSLMAQDCGGLKPTWASASYKKELANSYLEVVVISGTDSEEMINRARAEIENRRKLTVGENEAWVKSEHFGEYWECYGNQKIGYFLYQTQSDLNRKKEKVSVTDEYPFSARVFVPGMAQIYKGSVGKGVGFIVGEVALISGVIVSECLRLDYKQKIAMTHNSTLKQQYANNANACNIARNVCIGGVAAVYLWNIIDGIVAKGKSYVLVDGQTLNFMPFATTDGGGIAMNFTF